MKLTRDEHPETIRRYAHLRRGRSSRPCGVQLRGDRYTCTREKGHRGPHAAHGWFGRVLAVWTSDTLASPPAEPGRPQRDEGRSVRRGRRPVGLPTKSSAGVVEQIRRFAVRLGSSADQIAFVLLFVVFVWFAIEVLLRLY